MATCPTCRTHYASDVIVCSKDGETLLPDEAFAGVEPDLTAGTMVGEYAIESKLGEGGFGAVYKAVHPLIGKTAAIKVLNRQYSSNPQMVSRFIAEARAVNQIRHRNIIDIFAFGSLADGRQYYLMELLEGITFDGWLAHHGPMPPEQAIPLLRGVARALDAAHAKGIAHRDLKPENIFLVFDEDGVAKPKLLDFGIAKLMTDGGSAHKTRTGTPLGTPHYMSPEQCRGQNVDHRTDIYSFGVLAFQVLTASVPFDGEAVMDVLMKHLAESPPAVSAIRPELGTEFDAPVAHMLAKLPENRPQTLVAAVDELAAAAMRAGFDVASQATLGTSGPASFTGTARTTSNDPSSIGATTRQPTPADVAEFVHAKTMVVNDATEAERLKDATLSAAASGVGDRSLRGRSGVRLAIVAGVVILGVAAALVTLRARNSSLSQPPATAASIRPAGPTIPSATSADIAHSMAPTIGSAPPPADQAGKTVEITFQNTPAKAAVFLATKRMGDAPGPISIPYGRDKVTFTVKAPGYLSKDIDVVPVANTTVAAPLSKMGPAGPTKPKDFDNPF